MIYNIKQKGGSNGDLLESVGRAVLLGGHHLDDLPTRVVPRGGAWRPKEKEGSEEGGAGAPRSARCRASRVAAPPPVVIASLEPGPRP